ncbi:unnamed protein product [Prorocentrum cordatum]|uniref:Uncharacterized protein n=1 Tax=Prorocentrum cordatum TaxID=2364126 RepID=A0ABN9R9U0_9DINO|nr:unnamed protein product [Polarella glacialis]
MDMLCYCVGQRHNVASGPPKRRLSLFQEGRALGPSPTGFREALHGGEAVVATAGKFQGTSSASGPSSRGAAPLGSAGGEGEASGDGGASRYHLSTAPAGVGIAEQSTLRDTSPLHRFAQSVKGAMFAQEALREDAPDLASAVVFAAGAARQAPKVGRLETLDAFLIASPRGGQVQLPSPNMAVAGC